MTYVIGRKLLKSTLSAEDIAPIVLEVVDFLSDEALKNPKLQQKLWSIGAIVGNGIIAGTGMQKPKGKGGFTGMIYEAIGSYISNKVSPQHGIPEHLR